MVDPTQEAQRIIAEISEATKLALRHFAPGDRADYHMGAPVVQPTQMTDFVPRPELDAKLEAAEARMDARFARVEATMTTISDQLKGLKDDNVSLRQEVTDLRTETRSAGREFKYWAAASILAIVGTGVGIQQMTTSTFAGGSQFAKEQAQVVTELKQIQQDLAEQRKATAPPAATKRPAWEKDLDPPAPPASR